MDDARELVKDAHDEEPEDKLSLLLSAHVGNFQTALLNSERQAARAFLANVIALAEKLLTKVT